MGSVAAHLAHEIRNPIGSISLLASTLFARSELKNKHIVLEIQKAIARVERIVIQLYFLLRVCTSMLLILIF